MYRYQHIIFDLDGTLIDSAPAILASFRESFARTHRQPVCDIDEGIIGPPLPETLRILSGSNDPDVITELVDAFKASYDTTGYQATAPFVGITEMLRRLTDAGLTLSIATNKRIHPTQLILRHLGWDQFFTHVYALDLVSPRLPHKAAMIARLLSDQSIPQREAVYIGDRSEDGESADANGLPFIAVTWGYGSLNTNEMRPGWLAARHPDTLGDMLLAN